MKAHGRNSCSRATSKTLPTASMPLLTATSRLSITSNYCTLTTGLDCADRSVRKEPIWTLSRCMHRTWADRWWTSTREMGSKLGAGDDEASKFPVGDWAVCGLRSISPCSMVPLHSTGADCGRGSGQIGQGLGSRKEHRSRVRPCCWMTHACMAVGPLSSLD